MQMYIVRSRGVIIHDEKLLVVHHPKRDFYALPGGHVDTGESPKECMERELQEELGVAPVVGRILYVYTYANKDGIHAVEFFFEIENSNDFLFHEDKEKTHAHEIDEVLWISTHDNVRILPPEFFEEFKSGQVFREGVRFLKG